MSKNKVKFGLSNVHVAPITVNDDNTFTYGTIIPIPGAVNLTLDPSGEDVDFKADNIPYFNDSANQGYEGSLELALVPDSFREKILGEYIDNNGAFFENRDDEIKPFALGFQIDGDKSNRKFWYFNVTAKRPATGSKTIENTKEPVTETLNIKALIRPEDGEVRTFLEPNESNTAAYNGFFESVYVKVPKSV